MTDLYADGQLASGLNDGTSWANAYQGAAGLQAALDAAVAGDTIHICRTFTLAAKLDIDQHAGGAGAPIRVLGYNYNAGSPVNDGTRALLDANAAAVNCIAATQAEWWIENVEFAHATGDNVTAAAACNYWVFLRCVSRDAGDDGWGGSWRYSRFVLCEARDCANKGLGTLEYGCLAVACVATGNGSYGLQLTYGATAVFCLSADNGGAAFDLWYAASIVACVGDDSQRGVYLHTTGPSLAFACRLTNHGMYGLDQNGKTLLDLYNVLLGNAALDPGTGFLSHADRGAETRLTAGEQAYEDAAVGKFSLRLGAAGYRSEIDLPDGLNFLRLARGLPASVIGDFSKTGGKQP